jgi:hypothetical protein
MLSHPSFSSALINEDLPAGPQRVFTLNNRFFRHQACYSLLPAKPGGQADRVVSLCKYKVVVLALLKRWEKTTLQSPHCKDTILKIWNKYSQKSNCAATVPIPTFMFLRAIYTFSWSVCRFCSRKTGGPNAAIYRSLTDTWMWKLGRRPRNSFSGNTKCKFLCSAVTTTL